MICRAYSTGDNPRNAPGNINPRTINISIGAGVPSTNTCTTPSRRCKCTRVGSNTVTDSARFELSRITGMKAVPSSSNDTITADRKSTRSISGFGRSNHNGTASDAAPTVCTGIVAIESAIRLTHPYTASNDIAVDWLTTCPDTSPGPIRSSPRPHAAQPGS